MKVLVVGSGGREHALVWKLRQSPSVTELFCAPGNAGIGQQATLVPIKATELNQLLTFSRENEIDLTVVGPELPLVEGIVDLFEQHGMKIFGPRKAAAMLEGSKVFSKEFMGRHKIPTARSQSFSATDLSDAKLFLQSLSLPVVIKADGLAAGKGVVICQSRSEAVQTLEEMLSVRAFGSAGDRVIIEEYLQGEEASVFVLTDGKDFMTLAPAQDHKRALDGDLGKNTGGMGAYAPAPLVNDTLMQQVVRDVVRPTLSGMQQDGMPYTGCLYCGLMVTEDGPKVLEYNCRFGDPEAQVVIPLIEGDAAALLLSIAKGTLDARGISTRPGSAVCVVMASGGYPDAYETGCKISGLDSIDNEGGLVVFHAGTKKEGNDLVTAGGRVLGVTALGLDRDIEKTVAAAYRGTSKISFEGAHFRRDIGLRAVKRLQRNTQ